MARLRTWAVSAIGAAAAGAGLAVARRRRPTTTGGAGVAYAPPPPPAAPPPTVPAEAEVPPAHAPAEDDPQAALDAARARLRSRAEGLRREIEDTDRGAPGGA